MMKNKDLTDSLQDTLEEKNVSRQHDLLMERVNQHKPKNSKSKQDDKNIYIAMKKVIDYLDVRFGNSIKDYNIVFSKEISISYMIDLIKTKDLRNEFCYDYLDRKIKPDGGVLYLVKKDNSFKKPILISEIKRQGTNAERLKKGLPKQATGNAIERLGKNLIGIRSMMNHERITPFICFGWGDDFKPTEKTVLSKVFVMNEFYPLNKIYVNKKDGDANLNRFSPVSMFFREKIWTVDEMFEIMKEIAETSLRYYIY